MLHILQNRVLTILVCQTRVLTEIVSVNFDTCLNCLNMCTTSSKMGTGYLITKPLQPRQATSYILHPDNHLVMGCLSYSQSQLRKLFEPGDEKLSIGRWAAERQRTEARSRGWRGKREDDEAKKTRKNYTATKRTVNSAQKGPEGQYAAGPCQLAHHLLKRALSIFLLNSSFLPLSSSSCILLI